MPESRGLVINEAHLENVFRALAEKAELQESVTVVPYHPRERTVRLRVLRLGKFGGGASVLDDWEES